MVITSNLKIDLQNNSGSAWIQVMQEDTNTRCLEIQLYRGDEIWEIPEGTTAAVGFKKPDGTAGLYDKLPDGTDAITLSENTVSVMLVPQMMTVPGLVRTVVTLYDAERNQLSTFPFHIQVEENPAAGALLSENYGYCTSVAEINEALNAALNTLEETVTAVEAKMENGAFNGKSAYEYALEGGYRDTEEAFSQALAGGMADEETIEKIVADYLEENPPVSGGVGENGATFTPALDAAGNLSWSNDKGLANPATVNIKGPQGDTGPQGLQGETGAIGPAGPQGEKGETGPKGEKGEDGTGVTILGSYETAEGLLSEHPTGTVGESYLVAGHLFVWSQSDSSWVDVGNIQGPQGEKGEKGDTGLQGPQGEKGDQGEPGVSGQDGVSATHWWNGTTLTIASASGTSSADLKGDAGAAGEKGDKGDAGADGYSPVRGTDYWTAADIAEIKSYVDNAILGGAW